VHIVIKPDKDCVVNSGLGSIRGARIAEMSYLQQRNTQLQRLTDPMVWRYGQMQPTSLGRRARFGRARDRRRDQ
jgi:arsenite oxidase large subunit